MRLTKKVKELWYLADPIKSHLLIKKLGQLEDLEDDLKLSLDIFVKALLNGVYFKDNKNEIKHSKVKFIAKEKCFALIDEENKQCGDLRFGSYGKTWALTKEELL